jgi:hypothetical protein
VPFIVDDLLLRIFGISIPPFDMLWLLEQISGYAYAEMYDVEEINNAMKENRLLYEFGEITEAEYEKKNERLNHKLKMANHLNNTHMKNRVNGVSTNANITL